MKQILCEPGSWIEYKTARFIFLIAAGVIGLIAGPKISPCIADIFYLNDNLIKYLEPLVVGVLVITLLWHFRTYDTRHKIYQDDLFKGLDNLASGNPLQVDIGVAMLREISKKVPSFNEIIKVAFIRRLKSMPSEYESKILRPKSRNSEYKSKNESLLSYAQHIMRWLILHKKENENIYFNLNGLDLSRQEFAVGADGKKIIFKELLDYDSVADYVPLLKNFSLQCVDISGLDFTGVRVIKNDGKDIYFDTSDDNIDVMNLYLQQEEVTDCSVIR